MVKNETCHVAIEAVSYEDYKRRTVVTFTGLELQPPKGRDLSLWTDRMTMRERLRQAVDSSSLLNRSDMRCVSPHSQAPQETRYRAMEHAAPPSPAPQQRINHHQAEGWWD